MNLQLVGSGGDYSVFVDGALLGSVTRYRAGCWSAMYSYPTPHHTRGIFNNRKEALAYLVERATPNGTYDVHKWAEPRYGGTQGKVYNVKVSSNGGNERNQV